jgi:hypothetical protein
MADDADVNPLFLCRHCEEGDEAIQTFFLILDCFAEPVIGPRFARTRWLAMTTR